MSAGFIRSLEKYGKVWNKIWSISRLEKAGKNFFLGLLVWKKKLFFQTLSFDVHADNIAF